MIRRPRAAGAALLLLAALLLAACAPRPEPVHHDRFLVLGTLVDLTLWDADEDTAQRAAAEVLRVLRGVHERWHAWEDSPLTRLNQALAAGRPFPLEPGMAEVLREARRLSALSGGLFDPGIGALVRLWGFQSDDPPHGPPPPEARIQALLARGPSIAHLRLEAGPEGVRARSETPTLQLDLGAFLKGWAVDQAVERLHAMGLEDLILNAGGDLRASGDKGGRPWRIGIRDPRGPGVLASLEIRGDEAVFTSGDYERYYDWEGVRYHHLIDPRTGRPARGTLSVTVVHPRGAVADAAATALFVAGPEGWREVARRMHLTQVMLVAADGTVHLTPAMERRMRFESRPARVVVEQVGP